MALRLALSHAIAPPLRSTITHPLLRTSPIYTQHVGRTVSIGFLNTMLVHFAALPSFISDLWESVLRAVPKKKTSHRKKRQRFLAGKALKDVTNLNKCAACGTVKRAHLLCPYCVQEIREMWKKGLGDEKRVAKAEA
ncbi:MAG: hypothetical protein L6R39_003462 [Caloplaca ligustica]|nr:MAG: hypothetical protein L6R39_003462 [Caloplaca ligustica]